MKINKNISGFIILFFTVSFSAIVSILIYDKLQTKNFSLGIITFFIFLNIIVVTLFYCLIDYLRRKLTIDRPVKNILKATEQIASGDFDINLTPSYAFGRMSELDEIIININKMAKELSTNELQKSDFIANFSHEVKTPLASMNNYLTLLSEKNVPEDKKQEYYECLKTSLLRLTTLTSEILKLNKLENGTLVNHKETLHLDGVLTDSILIYEDKIDEKNIDLQCDINPIIYTTYKVYFETIASNLISNAIKFTSQQGKIEIKLWEDEDNINLLVKDNGCGMSEETGKHIFEKFYQGDTSHSQEGNGLGLAMVKKIIDIIGGTIAVSSKLNEGSTFIVKLKKE